MANTDSPTGLRPTRYKSGAPYNGADNEYYVSATDANPLFPGDPVIITGDGSTAGVPGITLAGATGRITGIVVGFAPNPQALAGTKTAIDYGFRAPNTEDWVLVADDPDLLYEVQADGAAATADIGSNANLIVGTGSPVTKRSGWELDSTSYTTALAQVRVQGFVQRVDNEVDTNAKLLVSIVETTQSPADGSIGV